MIRRGRERALGIGLAIVIAALAAVALDAGGRGHEPAIVQMAAIARVTGLPELALSSSSRWLRHPSLAEPDAANWDAPLGLDVDPAGAAIGRSARRSLSPSVRPR